jgi:hypothetical protein
VRASSFGDRIVRRLNTAKTIAKRELGAARCALPGQPRSRPDEAVLARVELFKASEAKLGFVPTLRKTFAFDTGKPEAYVGYRNDPIQGQSGLS